MNKVILAAFAFWSVFICNAREPADTVYSEQWDISDLEEIGGHGVTVFGDPQVVSTELGDAVEFDGVEDQLIVDFNPLKDATEFTIEVILWPAACYPDNKEPRFFHIQDPDDTQGKRVMMELRINQDNHCYLDGFMKNDLESLTLIDETLIHPTESWHHVAISYRDSTFRTYFNGVEELSGTCRYAEKLVNPIGKTSLGARMNQVAHFSGKIKTVRVTHACLEPPEFMAVQDTLTAAVSPDTVFADYLQVFPNPAGMWLRLTYSGNTGSGMVRLVDLTGKAAYVRGFRDRSEIPTTINTSGLSEGIYTLIFQSGHRIHQRRIVILHR